MALLFDSILYKKDSKRFEQIREIAAGFSSYYIGQNIIQDDIFTVIENYARTKEMPLEWLRFPIRDPELCACTFIRSGRIFVMLNSGIPMSKQIFAAAHELYHIRCFLDEDNSELIKQGSILNSATIEAGTTEAEEMEANAFAGILLAPVDALEQQIRIYQINKQAIEMAHIYASVLSSLLEFFAALISNNLNMVMKFLASMTIVLSVPSIIFGLWGTNVILPFSDNPFGFLIILVISILISLLIAIILYKKDMF